MILEVRSVGKRFGPLVALEDVSATFRPSHIHAVVGENGAGKSTLMGLLSGFLSPDSGEILLDGKPIPYGSANACRRLGIEMIHQHFTLVPEFTVEENLALSGLPSLGSVANPSSLAEPAIQLGTELGWKMDPLAKVKDLPVGMQQRIEILKSLATRAPVLILDEPTAVLTPEEVDELFRVLTQLRQDGKTIILIAHKLREVFAIADEVTVLRRGKLVGHSAIDKIDEPTLATWIVGDLPAPPQDRKPTERKLLLEYRDLTVLGDRGEEAVRSVSFELHQGEIMGFGGVDGNGQVELAEFLAGVRQSGSSWQDGEVAYIPQDRQIDGLALNMSVLENVAITAQRLPRFSKGPFLVLSDLRGWAKELIQRFDIRVSGPDEPVGALSGGNQQKVVVSRALATRPDLVVAVNPTRGLDLKAAAFVREQLLLAREQGAAVALFTTDLDELFEVSDRQVFMSGGKLLSAESAGAMLGSGV